jgi:hypothetical protein
VVQGGLPCPDRRRHPCGGALVEGEQLVFGADLEGGREADLGAALGAVRGGRKGAVGAGAVAEIDEALVGAAKVALDPLGADDGALDRDAALRCAQAIGDGRGDLLGALAVLIELGQRFAVQLADQSELLVAESALAADALADVVERGDAVGDLVVARMAFGNRRIFGELERRS